MARKYWVSLIAIILVLSVLVLSIKFYSTNLLSPVTVGKDLTPAPKPLEKYSFENLKQREFTGGSITYGEKIKDEDSFISKVFYFYSDGKRVSGLANIPKITGKLPVIIMVRGYVDEDKYFIGEGTNHAGEVFARNGFLTLAPDFLGYGESDRPSANNIEERFETYTTVLNLLASIKHLDIADSEKIGIWGHSNGGQIALSVLAISGKPYPTVLWAPVTKPFPYSVLYYTDEFEDHGKKLRRLISDFEKDYDIEQYSPTNYFDWITAPIELHQGGNDEAVPQKWTDEFALEMKKLNKDIIYFTYPGENHNFAKGSWNIVIQRNIAFFRHNLERFPSSE